MESPVKRRRASRPKATPAALTKEVAPNRFVIGIGFSAGGLEAVVQFLSNLPAGLGTPVIIIQHLSPTHKSMLVQLLARETSLVVSEAKDGDVPEGDHIYAAPPNHNLTLNDGALHLSNPALAGAPKPSVDMFFESLASDAGEHAIGVVLSGIGSDGAKGIRCIKAVGGYTFAQDPATAKYDGMPSAALVTGHVDLVLSPPAIADAIAEIVRKRGLGEGMLQKRAPPEQFKQLLHRLRARTRLDFSGYKETTVLRRIERRMVANHVSGLDEYINVIGEQPEELDRLAKDILISVTNFSRDPDAFKTLGVEIGKLLQRKRSREELRLWVAGCATGEEAYTIAMLCLDHIERGGSHVRLQIFATDVDLDAIAVARRGLYSEGAVSDVPKELLSRYFEPCPQGYEAKPVLRDCIVFSRQDLVQDPPFPRIDVISCRNLLIYFQPALQARVIPLLHYALRSGGLLFLGKSETLNQFDELFEPVDKNARLYRSRGLRQLPAGLARTSDMQMARLQAAEAPVSLEQRLYQAAARLYFPPMALLSRDFEVRHTFGDVSAFLSFPEGRPSLNLGKVIREEYFAEAQALLLQARKTHEPASGRPRRLDGETGRAVRLVAHSVVFDQNEHLLLTFESIVSDAALDPSGQADGEAAAIRELQEQLIAAREHVQSVVEELETSNEEMQALNEELQSTNEELQTSNEELETANEELQVTNEELITVNEELHLKTGMFSEANNELENIINSAGYPLLVFDEESQLTRFNAAASVLFGLSLEAGTRRAAEPQMPEQISGFVRKLDVSVQQRAPYEEEVQLAERHYILRITPRLIKGGEKVGAIVSLLDITALAEAKAALSGSEKRMRYMLQNSPALVYVTRPDGIIEYVNPGFERVFRAKAVALTGRHEDEVLTRQSADLMRRGRLAALERRQPVESEEAHPCAEGTRHFIAVRFPILDDRGEVEAVCSKLIDISVRKQAEEALTQSESQLREVLDALPADVVVVDREGRIIQVNEAWERFGAENGVSGDKGKWIGVDYLAASRAQQELGDPAAAQMEAGIRAVLAGQRSSFVMEHPCHSQSEQRWFLMHVMPLPRNDGAVIVHQDVTDQHMIQRQLAEVNETLERRVTDRTRELDAMNKELETFAFSISHDLQSPLRAVSGFSTLVLSEHADRLEDDGRAYLRRVVQACQRMSGLIDELLELLRLARRELLLSDVDLSNVAEEIVEGLRAIEPTREVQISIEPGLVARCDMHLVHALLENLLSNAWKFTSPKRNARVELGRTQSRGVPAFFIRDNGVGFDMKYADKLFRPLQRLHDIRDFPGHGLGLTNVMRIARRHGGEVWAEAVEGAGATFFFTLGPQYDG